MEREGWLIVDKDGRARPVKWQIDKDGRRVVKFNSDEYLIRIESERPE